MDNSHFSKHERETVAKEVYDMIEAFNRGVAKALIERSHHSVYELAGGREKLEAALMEAAKQLMEKGVVIESFRVGLPGKLYQAGTASVCFIPKTTVMMAEDLRFKSTSYMVAIRDGDGTWGYLDGAGARRDPEQLWELLPDLPKDVKLPENTIRPLGACPRWLRWLLDLVTLKSLRQKTRQR